MNWEAISAVGELIGALAVLVTLIYLATQLRQNTDQAKQANMIAQADISAQVRARYEVLWHQISADPQLAVAFNKLMFRDEEVDTPDAARLRAWFATYCTVAQSAHIEHLNGLVDDWTLETLEGNVRWFITKPLFNGVYREIVSRGYGMEFKMRAWADRIDAPSQRADATVRA